MQQLTKDILTTKLTKATKGSDIFDPKITFVLSFENMGHEDGWYRAIPPFSCSVGERKIMNHFVVQSVFMIAAPLR